MAAFQRAVSSFADSLTERMLLCACLGALHFEGGVHCNGHCYNIMGLFIAKRLDDAVFTTLQQVMQVHSQIIMLGQIQHWCPHKPC